MPTQGPSPPASVPLEHPSESHHQQASSSDAAAATTAPTTEPRFSPEEEATLLSESNAQKSQANALYTSSSYSQAVSEYDKALASCPNYLDYEIAVLKANIAACHIQLREWTTAVDAATAAIDALERVIPLKPLKGEKGKDEAKKKEAPSDGQDDNNDTVVELEGDDEEAEQALANLALSDQRRADVQKIRAKALLRRAKAKAELGGWGNLQGAEDDYKILSSSPILPILSPADKKVVQNALKSLPGRIKACRDEEMGEMMGKLKDLGNGILKPFGLSTDMFNMVQDEKTGGYSMNFNQGR